MPPRKKIARAAKSSAQTGDGKAGKKQTVKGQRTAQKRTIADAAGKQEKKSVKTEPDSGASTSKSEPESMKKMRFSAKIPVDEHCTKCSSGYHVHTHVGNVYNAMLNQTNIGENNNKYYVMQILKHDTKEEYITWYRWGRVGKIAGTGFKSYGADQRKARRDFEKKFHQKTDFPWPFRSGFIKKQGYYDLIKMDYGDNDDEPESKVKIEKGNEGKEDAPSKLDKKVGDLIDLIFDVKEFEAAVKEMEYDVKKAPLGKLTTTQIKAGYESLKKIEDCIQKKDFGPNDSKLNEVCSEFYTRIPHDFGMKRPPLIKTSEELKAKLQLLEALSEIQIAIQIIKDEKTSGENIKDVRYKSLGCKLEPLDPKDSDFKMVKNYVANSHGSTHKQYNLKVEEVFKVQRDQDEKRFKKNIGNRMLLWHGSRITNWCGILKQGLRIAPPEAPVTGYMFGKGVYFADMVSKSANYCFATKRQPRGFLLLCEVALGNTSDKTSADCDANKLPTGKHSTKGLGQEIPDPKGNKKLKCGTIVPLGRPQNKPSHGYWLRYNEYIVYDTAQIRPRFLVKANFTY